MHVSFINNDLIEEVEEDIELFGKDFKIYAVYSWYPQFDKEFITDYIYAEEPTRDEALDDEDYKKLMINHKKGLDTLKYTKHKEMSLEQLLNRLIDQSKVI